MASQLFNLANNAVIGPTAASAAAAVGNDTAASNMASLAPGQLNNANGKSFFIEIGADLTADLPPIAGDPSEGGGLQTGRNDQQKPLAPSYVISLSHIIDQVGYLDPSKFYASWKVALDTAYVSRNTTLAPDDAIYPTNPSREALSKKAEPVYLCSEQLQQACGGARYFTRFGQAEITEGLYTTAFARFERTLPHEIAFQFPVALDFLPDNSTKYYSNSPRIEGTRDLSSGRPMAAPYYENQFVQRFNIRFIITVEVGLNAQPVYGRVSAPNYPALGQTPGLSFIGAGSAAQGSAGGNANVESEAEAVDEVRGIQDRLLQTAQGHIDDLMRLSQSETARQVAAIGGDTGSQVLSGIGQTAGALTGILQQLSVGAFAGGAAGRMVGGGASSRLPLARTSYASTGGSSSTASTELFAGGGGIQLGGGGGSVGSLSGFSMPSSLASSASSLPTPRLGEIRLGSDSLNSSFASTYSESLSSAPISVVGSAFKPKAGQPFSRGGGGGYGGDSEFGGLFGSFGGGGGGASSAAGVSEISRIPATAPLGGAVTTTAASQTSGAARPAVSFEPATTNSGGVAIHPYSGRALLEAGAPGVDRRAIAKQQVQARDFWTHMESGAPLSTRGTAKASGIQVKFAEDLRAALGGNRGIEIDKAKLSDALAGYARMGRSGGNAYAITRANVGTAINFITGIYNRSLGGGAAQ